MYVASGGSWVEIPTSTGSTGSVGATGSVLTSFPSLSILGITGASTDIVFNGGRNLNSVPVTSMSTGAVVFDVYGAAFEYLSASSVASLGPWRHKTTLGGSVSSLTISNIPSVFRILRVHVVMKAAATAYSYYDLKARVNSITSYREMQIYHGTSFSAAARSNSYLPSGLSAHYNDSPNAWANTEFIFFNWNSSAPGGISCITSASYHSGVATKYRYGVSTVNSAGPGSSLYFINTEPPGGAVQINGGSIFKIEGWI